MDFDKLPFAVVAAVEELTGPVLKSQTVSQGFNSEIGARIIAESGSYFAKGLHADHRRSWTQNFEAEVNPYIRGIAPALLWRVQESGWDILGFEAVDGHHADYSPDSSDLPKVADSLLRLRNVTCPDIKLRQAEKRLSRYVEVASDLDYFSGSALLHTDLNNANFVIGYSTYLVDWAWATRGAPWLDAGYWVIWLMAAGHTPESAEQWAAHIPAWRAAPGRGVDAFAVANANVWDEIGGSGPDSWTNRMVKASRLWAHYRKG